MQPCVVQPASPATPRQLPASLCVQGFGFIEFGSEAQRDAALSALQGLQGLGPRPLKLAIPLSAGHPQGAAPAALFDVTAAAKLGVAGLVAVPHRTASGWHIEQHRAGTAAAVQPPQPPLIPQPPPLPSPMLVPPPTPPTVPMMPLAVPPPGYAPMLVPPPRPPPGGPLLSPVGPPRPPPGLPPGLPPALPPPSRVVLLRNMVSDAEASDPTLPGEIQVECTRWGEVQAVRVFEGWGEAAADGAANVKIFVVFAQPSGAQGARTGLDQRWFGGRRVEATLYDQARFDRLDLSG